MGVVVVPLLLALHAYMLPHGVPGFRNDREPRIVGIPLEHARAQIQRWADAETHGDERANARLVYEVANARHVGSVALVDDDEIKALALLERIANSTHL